MYVECPIALPGINGHPLINPIWRNYGLLLTERRARFFPPAVEVFFPAGAELPGFWDIVNNRYERLGRSPAGLAAAVPAAL
jgi:hypothetical protein